MRRESPDESASDDEVYIHQGPKRRSGGCALKVLGLTPGGLHGCPIVDCGSRKATYRRVEVSRGHSTLLR